MRAAGAQYSVLSIQRLRGRGSVPIGVILLDPAKDMLWGRFREDLAEIADEDELDVLEGMADMIATRAREEGATRLFHGLLDTLSNYVRIRSTS